MFRKHSVWALIFVGVAAWAAAFAAEPEVTPRTGLLVLRNGRVLRGRITRIGDRYLVNLGGDNEVRLPTTDVDFICRDLQQAYRLKWASREPGADGHLELVDWCLRHDLLTEAADQLLAAMTADPRHPRLQSVQRRLHLAIRQGAPPAVARPSSRGTSSRPVTQQVERKVDDLPAGVVEQFTNHVQPLLLNRCSAGRCHGGTNSGRDFRLLRPSFGSVTRRFTQRNLFNTLAMVDRDRPENSRLLDALKTPHGGVSGSVFGPRGEAQYELLRRWVAEVGRGHELAQPSTITKPDSILLQPTPQSGGRATALRPVSPASRTGDVRPASAELPISPDSASGDSPTGTSPTGASPADTPATQPAGKRGRRDPFDPEVFNRRYFPPPKK